MSGDEQVPKQERHNESTPPEDTPEIEYLPVVGLDDEADGRDEDITPEEQAEAKALTEHTHQGVIGHRVE